MSRADARETPGGRVGTAENRLAVSATDFPATSTCGPRLSVLAVQRKPGGATLTSLTAPENLWTGRENFATETDPWTLNGVKKDLPL